jgi:integrase
MIDAWARDRGSISAEDFPNTKNGKEMAHRSRSIQKDSEDLVFTTPTGTPLSSENLYNRVLAPACDRIKEPRVSWHSFRHAHATLLAEPGESMKTAQALLGHSDLETTLNIYTHALPASQRRAVERVSEVMFSIVLELGENEKEGNLTVVFKTVRKRLVNRGGLEPPTR